MRSYFVVLSLFTLFAAAIAFIILLFTSPVPAAALCNSLITPPLYYGLQSKQVIILQDFLIADGESIPAGATGYFGTQTRVAVDDFQLKYAGEILLPLGLYAPTGAVYASTAAQIDALSCE